MNETLGARELDVLTALWDHGPSTVADVRSRLPARLAYTTVLTILRNLEAKEMVGHTEEGKTHRYFARIERGAVQESAVGRVVDTLFGGKLESLLTHLVDARGLEPDELRRLHDLLSSRLGAPRKEDA
jgi:BlaI family transcriptional regulator, penicillinase repressor